MYSSKLILLCLLFYVASAADVLESNDQDFEDKLSQHDTALVLFYAPWCGHCKKLKPEFAEAASELIKNKPPVSLIQVDCTEGGTKTCEKYDIADYPSLKIFQNGEFAQNYGGSRSSEDIVKYMKKQVIPDYKDISAVHDLDMFLRDANKVAVVGFFDKDSNLKTAFFQVVAKLSHKAKFGECLNKTVLKEKGICDGVVLLRPRHLHNIFEDDSVVYSGPAAVKNITNFINENYHGLVGHRQAGNRKDFKKPLVVVYCNIDYQRNPKGTNYWRNRVLKVAKQYKNEMNFAISNRDEFQHDLIDFDVTYEREDKPTVLARDAKNQKYLMKDTFSEENLNNFVEGVVRKKLKPYLRSEPIPEKNDGPVKVAVAENFEDLVINSKRDTLIAFYAPWCGHCKKLAPLYDELGTRLKNEEIDIVKMDATANDISPKFSIQNYPTVYWVPKKAKENPVLYAGATGIDELIKFIAENAAEEMKGFDRAGNPKRKEAMNKTEL